MEELMQLQNKDKREHLGAREVREWVRHLICMQPTPVPSRDREPGTTYDPHQSTNRSDPGAQRQEYILSTTGCGPKAKKNRALTPLKMNHRPLRKFYKWH